MSGLQVLTWALLTIAGAAVVLLGSTAVGRVRRRRRTRRHRVLADALRPSIVAVVAEPDEPHELPPYKGRVEDLFDVLAFDFLAKVRGESREALVRLLDARGTIAAAERRTRRRGTVGRSAAAEFVGRCGLARSRPALEDLLGARSATARAVAVRALGHLGDPAAAPALLAVAERPTEVPPSLVTQSLVRLGPSVVGVVRSHLRSPSVAVRCVAVDALGLLRAVDAVADLMQTLSGDELEPAIRAARALGRIEDPRAVGPLLQVLEDDRSPALVAVAARSLGTLGDPAAAPALGQLLHRGGPAAENAASALLRLQEPGIVELTRAVNGEPPNRTAIAALSRHAVGRTG